MTFLKTVYPKEFELFIIYQFHLSFISLKSFFGKEKRIIHNKLFSSTYLITSFYVQENKMFKSKLRKIILFGVSFDLYDNLNRNQVVVNIVVERDKGDQIGKRKIFLCTYYK